MKTETMGRVVGVVASLCAVGVISTGGAGCDNRHVLGAIGDEDGGASPPSGDAMILTPDVGPTVDGPPDGAVLNQDGAVLTPVQSWTGYIENYKFPSGSDAVKISFASTPTGELVGTVTLGNGTSPPPATDPNVGYPADLLASSLSLTAANRYIAEGFGYSIRAGTLTGGRLRFGVGTWELWTGWCALQTPVPPQGVCDEPVCQGSCLPNRGSMSGPNGCGLFNPATNQYDPVDCGKLALCGFSSVCLCYASCTARDTGTQIMFDVAITDDRASGSVAGLGDHNVHFTKDP